MAKNLFKVIIFFAIGTAGGIFADQILWPYFIERPLFYEYRLEQSPVYVTERKEITVKENVALQEAVEKVEKVVVGVRSKTLAGEVLEGSGLIVTSDGLLITLADLVPQGSAFYFFVDGKWPSYQILKRDFENNLALVKIEDGGLPTVGFTDFQKTRLGERVFLVGMDYNLTKSDLAVLSATSTATGTDSTSFSKKALIPPKNIVNEGIIKFLDKDLIKTNIFEQSSAAGSPLFDIGGNVVGLNMIDKKGEVSAISVTQIREFIGF